MQESKQPCSRVIFLDYGLFLHRAIFGWSIRKGPIPATYTCLNMMLASLRNIGVRKTDTVIVAIDGRGNWRRDVDPSYKANRKELKKDDGIDWKHWYQQFDNMVEKLKVSSPFYYIRIDKLEADDIIAVGCRYYRDRDCIIVSSDSDFEQLYALPNVKIYSPVSKKFKIIDNPYQILASKIKKEKTDNLLSDVLDEVDYSKRNAVVNLLKLPEEVEKKVLDVLETMCDNDYQLQYFPFKSLVAKFKNIYNNPDPLTYDKMVEEIKQAEEKEKLKKEKIKLKKKKTKERLKKREEKQRKEMRNVQTNQNIFE